MSCRVCSDCLEEGARLNPSGIALEGESRSLSYAELAERAARLELPDGNPGVALWTEKTVDAVTALLGIQSAGRTCIPIDPLNPPDRTIRILEDARPGVLLASRAILESTGEQLRKRLPGLRISDLTSSFSGPARKPKKGSPEEIAYLLYTSGSSGAPKGVMISHRAAMTFVDWSKAAFGLGPGDRVASIAPLHFDLSLFDLYSTLSAGATVSICSRGILNFPESLLNWIWSERINTVYATPTLLSSLAGVTVDRRLSKLKRVLFAGEVMPVAVLRRLMQEAPEATFHNLYGPTETNVCTMYQVVAAPPPDQPLPIGHPCPYNRVDVIAENGSPAAIGEIGEIRVEGPNVMTGYWGATEQAGPYLTGDLGFRDSAGLIHFRGRRDGMLKIRGHRVEPAEVEASLGSHPDVLQAAAFKIVDASGLEALASVVVLRKGSLAGEAELQRYCGERLPRYMVPSRIEIRETLPLNPHGKVDRPALSAGKA